MRDDRDLDALLDSLAQTEREGYERGLGDDLLAAMESADERHEEQARALLDAITRAQLDQEDDKQ